MDKMLEHFIGIFLGNVRDIYNSDILDVHKKEKIAEIASCTFAKPASAIMVVFVSNEERAMCDIMESSNYYYFDRVEVSLSSTFGKIAIFLEKGADEHFAVVLPNGNEAS